MILKVKLFVLAALILLSSINSIFNSIPIIGVSAQEYEEIDYGSTGINEMVQNYLYEKPNAYNTDNGYSNEEYSSYDNYEYSPNNEYVQDDFSTYNPSSYKNEYSDNSYDESYYPPKEPEKFTCKDSGIVVDKEENCPLVCPAGTDLEGHLVAAGSNLQVVCDEDAQFETCPAGTDLDGVLVESAPEDCNIFATCTASDPLGLALGLTGTETVEVVDEQLCRLGTSSGTNLIQCPADSNLGGNALVTNIALCNAATEENQCPTTPGIDLPGVYVDDPTTQCNIFDTCDATTSLGQALGLTGTQTVEVADEQLCDLEVPQLDQCGPTDNIPNALVTDLRLCNAATEANICPTTPGIDLPGVYVDDPTTQCNIFDTCDDTTPLGISLGLTTGETVEVADEQLCDLEVPQVEQCEEGTDLEGILVDPAETESCNLSPTDITTNFGAQCMKCSDLAALQGAPNTSPGQSAQLQASVDLIGENATDASVFTICDDPATASSEFNSTITISMGAGGNAQENRIEGAFELCMNNALAQTLLLEQQSLQAQASYLQEESLITNVKPENEIPSLLMMPLPTFTPPY